MWRNRLWPKPRPDTVYARQGGGLTDKTRQKRIWKDPSPDETWTQHSDTSLCASGSSLRQSFVLCTGTRHSWTGHSSDTDMYRWAANHTAVFRAHVYLSQRCRLHTCHCSCNVLRWTYTDPLFVTQIRNCFRHSGATDWQNRITMYVLYAGNTVLRREAGGRPALDAMDNIRSHSAS